MYLSTLATFLLISRLIISMDNNCREICLWFENYIHLSLDYSLFEPKKDAILGPVFMFYTPDVMSHFPSGLL